MTDPHPDPCHDEQCPTCSTAPGAVWIRPAHVVDLVPRRDGATAISWRCRLCGGHTSVVPPCRPGRWSRLLLVDDVELEPRE